MKVVTTLLTTVLFLFSGTASARVFSFKDSSLGVMVRGTGGTTSLAKEPYGNSCGTDTSIDSTTKYNYGGELGVVLGMGSKFNIRLGAEVIQEHPITEGKGNNPSGTQRFSLNSSTFIFNPNLAAEIFMDENSSSRFFMQVGVGYAMANVANKYTMTSTGTTELGVGDFSETMSGSGISALIGAGMETTFLDNVTFSLEGGYRYMKISTLKYGGDVNNIVSPSGVKKGDTALNHNGSNRELDLGGVFVGASLRFYLHFM